MKNQDDVIMTRFWSGSMVVFVNVEILIVVIVYLFMGAYIL